MSFVHFYVGQEAVAVGISSALQHKDKVIGNHRSHCHYLAKGGNLFSMYSEMLGKATGCCRGKGGSMHMLDRGMNFLGSTPILSSGVPIAAGVAFSQKFLDTGAISVVYVGDGASEEGAMYETLNISSVLEIPILFVLKNNLYSVNTPRSTRRSEFYNNRKVIEGIGVKYFEADGNSFPNIFSEAKQAVQYVRSNLQPALIDVTVFRHMAHSAPLMDDHIGYRKVDTLEVREKADPIANLRLDLVQEFSAAPILEIENEVNLEILKALEDAIQAPMPKPEELYTDVFWH
jgi:pyruvate dehydrogenase E1 component alpha subunit